MKSNHFEIETQKQEVITQTVTCYTENPLDEDGGNIYSAKLNKDYLEISLMGRARLMHLPTLITLLETAVKEDHHKDGALALPLRFVCHDRDKEAFQEHTGQFDDNGVKVGFPSEDLWIANGINMNETSCDIHTITVLRASNRYITLENGLHRLSFDSFELGAVIAFLKKCLAVFTEDSAKK